MRHGFVNHVYSEVNGPPPIYSTSPVGATTTTQPMPQARHTYDTPDTLQAGTLPKKEPLPQDAVVELIPAKQVDLPDSKSSKEDLPVKFFHKRNTQNSSEFPQGPFVEDPRYEQPVISEAQLKLEPPPNYDDTKLQLMRENAASSILPNVPRKKRASELHGSANKERNSGNESPERSAVYKVQDATQEQSET